VGDLFLRVGRQILSWGETDNFQLLDHINPLDASFGGFLIPLDERRIPLDMVLANYYIGDFGPISEMYLEGFYAFDKEVGFSPETPVGSAWGLPGLSGASAASTTFNREPALNLTLSMRPSLSRTTIPTLTYQQSRCISMTITTLAPFRPRKEAR
jgi:hypothetical protein